MSNLNLKWFSMYFSQLGVSQVTDSLGLLLVTSAPTTEEGKGINERADHLVITFPCFLFIYYFQYGKSNSIIKHLSW